MGCIVHYILLLILGNRQCVSNFSGHVLCDVLLFALTVCIAGEPRLS